MLNVAPCHDAEYSLREVTRDATAYYLREGEAPGRWWGAGAAARGLAGEVDAAALRALFDGKDPRTGEYLISARGSSARSNARTEDVDLDVAAVAVLLGLSTDAVRTKLRSGVLAGDKTPRGHWRVPAAAVDAYRRSAPQPSCRGGLPEPAPDGTYGLAEAARRAGVHVSYLKRLVRAEAPEVPRRADGRPLQFLVGAKDDRGCWRVGAAELDRFISTRAAPNPVPAYDLAMRAPKSISILHALAHLVPPQRLVRLGPPANLAAEVTAAHHAAVADALGLLERRAGWIRGPGGRTAATGLTVARFDHRSSRTGDPLLHTHAVILNAATGLDGRRAALDGTALYAWASTAGHVYQARLRAELVARLGVRFHSPHHGTADVVGVPRELIDEFSERRRQVMAAMATLGTHGADAAQTATLATRAPKDDHSYQSPQRLAERAAAYGFGAEQLAALLGHGVEPAPSPPRLGEVAAQLAGTSGLTARTTRVDLRDAIRGFATELAGGASGTELERWSTALLNDGQRFVPLLASPARRNEVIRRADGRTVRAGGIPQSYSTPELLAHEAALVGAHERGLGPTGTGINLGVARREALAAALAERPSLSGEQVAMVRRVTTSGVGVEVVVGGPGAGKTFALGAAAAAWRASGLRVVGAALQGGAAEVLAREARLDDQHTLAGLLGRCDRHGAAELAGSVVLVDEAGMADTRQLSRLARYATAAGAKLVLVGDPDQIPEVGAGGAFAHLVATLGEEVIALRENRRQCHPGDRVRLGMIRRGRAGAAIASARADGRWHVAPSADALRARLLADWAGDPAAVGTDKVMIAPTVAEVEWLNRGARLILRAEGHLGPEALTIPLTAPDRAEEARELRVGDVVRATRNDWGARIFTGSVGTVTALDRDAGQVTVSLDTGSAPPRQVTLGAEFLGERHVRAPDGRTRMDPPGLAHAYASTAHGVQGRTALRAYVLVAPAGLHRQGAYVAASRAAAETLYYGLTVADPDEVDRLDGPRAAPPPDPNDVAALAAAMARDASQTMASVDDPEAAEVGRLMVRPPAWLWAEYGEIAERLGAGPPLAESLRQVRAGLADAYGLDAVALECSQLTAALTRALGVPGATPGRVLDVMTRRGRHDTRELDSATDPVAVLVWAATRAIEVLAHDASEPDADRRRLGLLDAAISRQRSGRLAMAETEPTGPVAGALGPPPGTVAGLAAWRRAAAAVVDYRDAAGLFEHEGGHADPWRRALGEIPAEPSLWVHHDQVRAIVVEARVSIALAELAGCVPPFGLRPSREVATLAQRPLAELEAELTVLRRAAAREVRLATRTRAAIDEAKRSPTARADQGSRTVPGLGRRASLDATAAAAAGTSGQSGAAGRTPRDMTAPVTMTPPSMAPPGRADDENLLVRAIAVRRASLRAEVLVDPPDWLRADLYRRVEKLWPPAPQWTERLAAAYGELAVDADRGTCTLDATTVAGSIDRAAPSAPAPASWLRRTAPQHRSEPEQAGVDLSP